MRSGLKAGVPPDGNLPSFFCFRGPEDLFPVAEEDAAAKSVVIAIDDCACAAGATRTRPTEDAENIVRPLFNYSRPAPEQTSLMHKSSYELHQRVCPAHTLYKRIDSKLSE